MSFPTASSMELFWTKPKDRIQKWGKKTACFLCEACKRREQIKFGVKLFCKIPEIISPRGYFAFLH
jgi:hypothetical protein